MNQIYIMGDIHQIFRPIRDLCQTLKYMNYCPDKSDTLILLGDSGANFFFDFHDRNFKEKLGRYDFTYFIIRGNHDARAEDCAATQPNDWHTEIFFGNVVRVENKYPYIKYALDQPALYNINGWKTLIYPGAYSVDKYYRITHQLGWFQNEQLSDEERSAGTRLAKENKEVDMILSHTCPKIYTPTDLFLNQVDQSLVDDTMERYLGNIEYWTDYKLWLFGHFHELRIYPKYRDDRQMMMLYNDYVLHLNAFQKNQNAYNSIIQVKTILEH